MNRLRQRTVSRRGWAMPLLLLLTAPWLAGCNPVIPLGIAVAADYVLLPVRSIVGSIVLGIINGTFP